jgi:hypothetical protein
VPIFVIGFIPAIDFARGFIKAVSDMMTRFFYVLRRFGIISGIPTVKN